MTRKPSPPPVTGISELVLEVADLDAARRFYWDVLGFDETLYGEGREGRYWYLIGDTARLGLWTDQVGLAGGRGGAHVHYAFHISDDQIDRLKQRIEDGGAEIEGPIQLGPGRAIYVDRPGRERRGVLEPGHGAVRRGGPRRRPPRHVPDGLALYAADHFAEKRRPVAGPESLDELGLDRRGVLAVHRELHRDQPLGCVVAVAR